ncbi:flavin reductase family protein [Phytohabitans houttuyneae]|uniref:Putative oxidoreductase n=1 Tax=Phytohabitans houttuyneae TaxID=1076126 RepID=A0A6V8KI52_9ACTN|nr:putative oxidoreductase [Phytohabitans houttuyneae]
MWQRGGVTEFVAGFDYPMFVVTAADPRTGERSGCLVGFATQCSIRPFRFLVCLSQANHTHGVAAASQMLAVHALSPGQHELAALFGEQTGDEIDKFARCAWTPGPHGTPLLDDCPRRLVGSVLERVNLGDHTGFLLAPIQEEGQPEPALMFSSVHDLEAGHSA